MCVVASLWLMPLLSEVSDLRRHAAAAAAAALDVGAAEAAAMAVSGIQIQALDVSPPEQLPRSQPHTCKHQQSTSVRQIWLYMRDDGRSMSKLLRCHSFHT